jgi:hypothetical protein
VTRATGAKLEVALNEVVAHLKSLVQEDVLRSEAGS